MIVISFSSKINDSSGTRESKATAVRAHPF
jgi:hypothetical protein